MFRENSLMLHGHPNHFGVLRLRLPPASVGLAQDDRRTEISEMLNCFVQYFGGKNQREDVAGSVKWPPVVGGAATYHSECGTIPLPI